MRGTLRIALRTIVLLTLVHVPIQALAQKPTVFNVADVVVGTPKMETRYLLAIGKWSDTDDDVGPYSVEIHCYKRFGFCNVANANMLMTGRANLSVTDFEILRWNSRSLLQSTIMSVRWTHCGPTLPQ